MPVAVTARETYEEGLRALVRMRDLSRARRLYVLAEQDDRARAISSLMDDVLSNLSPEGLRAALLTAVTFLDSGPEVWW